jgi:GntR family transcriptional repressor for pyruvate dehydrogenase complex
MHSGTRYARLADDVAQQVRLLIDDGEFRQGERLPPERELAERLGVARASIREGLRTLEMMGVIEIRPGRGSFVTGNVASPLDTLISSWFSVHRDWLREVIELREAVEAQAARLAAVRASTADFAAIERAIASMRLALDANDVDEFVEADAAFHDAIAHASANPLLRRALISIAREIHSYRLAMGRLLGHSWLERSLSEHEAIARAIQARDALAAWHAMRQHIVAAPRDFQILGDHEHGAAVSPAGGTEAGDGAF